MELNGIRARALLSANNYPDAALKKLAEQCEKTRLKRPVLIWALDHDDAGQRYTQKWVKQARKDGWICQAAQIPQPAKGKVDWNDCHQHNKLNEKEIETYLYQGSLLLARSKEEKAALLFNHNRRWQFHFEFGQQLYWFHLDPKKFNPDGDEAGARRVVGDISGIACAIWPIACRRCCITSKTK